MKNRFSNRLAKLDDYIFSQIRETKGLSSDLEPIDLSLGNPDDPPDREIIRTLIREAQTLESHRHPLYRGIPELKEKIAEWFFKRFKVKLNPETEILILAGSKQGLGLVGLTFLNKGDVALVPNPAYPVYRRGVLLAEGKPLDMLLLKENRWLPDLDKLSKKISSKTKIIFINYPNNPTGAVASIGFLKKLVDFAVKNDIIIISDMAYSEITFDNFKTHSILEIDEAKQRALEFFSFSKSFNMTGWRLGFVVGNKDLINALQKVRVTLDSGVFHLLQKGGITALSHSEKTKNICQIYQRRRDILFKGLKDCGWEVEKPEGAIFIWAKPPWQYSSNQSMSILKKKASIITTPGAGLGSQGEEYIRFSLTAPDEKIKQVVKRLKELPIGGKKR
ncbi:MAG: aminotransferase class I/II-fold pyridoxal phosphate-dependent enzyme [candidate division Zixibacteria bacterium]|nr:aminotransferase class I/II-fold pyridoxal phosphate-dependent enzyme [candidate division Zixibacteria bacterium]